MAVVATLWAWGGGWRWRTGFVGMEGVGDDLFIGRAEQGGEGKRWPAGEPQGRPLMALGVGAASQSGGASGEAGTGRRDRSGRGERRGEHPRARFHTPKFQFWVVNIFSNIIIHLLNISRIFQNFLALILTFF